MDLYILILYFLAKSRSILSTPTPTLEIIFKFGNFDKTSLLYISVPAITAVALSINETNSILFNFLFLSFRANLMEFFSKTLRGSFELSANEETAIDTFLIRDPLSFFVQHLLNHLKCQLQRLFHLF